MPHELINKIKTNFLFTPLIYFTSYKRSFIYWKKYALFILLNTTVSRYDNKIHIIFGHYLHTTWNKVWVKAYYFHKLSSFLLLCTKMSYLWKYNTLSKNYYFPPVMHINENPWLHTESRHGNEKYINFFQRFNTFKNP